MSGRGDQGLREAQFSFIGRILATVSHELKNHLAVIKEYSGLIEDLAGMGQAPSGGASDQYVTSVQAIHRQIERTLSLLRFFNRFSHRMDSARSRFSVNEAVEELLVLVHRLANQRRISLEREFRQDLPPVEGDPALLQFALFCLIEDAMGRLGKDGSLLLKTGRAAGSVSVGVISRGTVLPAGEGHPVRTAEALEESLRGLGAVVSRSAGGGEAILTLPLSAAPGGPRE